MKHYKVNSKSELKHIMFDIFPYNFYRNANPSVTSTADVSSKDIWDGQHWVKHFEVLTWEGKPYISNEILTYHKTKEEACERVAEILNLN